MNCFMVFITLLRGQKLMKFLYLFVFSKNEYIYRYIHLNLCLKCLHSLTVVHKAVIEKVLKNLQFKIGKK